MLKIVDYYKCRECEKECEKIYLCPVCGQPDCENELHDIDADHPEVSDCCHAETEHVHFYTDPEY